MDTQWVLALISLSYVIASGALVAAWRLAATLSVLKFQMGTVWRIVVDQNLDSQRQLGLIDRGSSWYKVTDEFIKDYQNKLSAGHIARLTELAYNYNHGHGLPPMYEIGWDITQFLGLKELEEQQNNLNLTLGALIAQDIALVCDLYHTIRSGGMPSRRDTRLMSDN